MNLIDPVSLTRELVRIESSDPGTYEQAVADRLVAIASPLLPECGCIERDEISPGRPVLMFVLKAGRGGRYATEEADGPDHIPDTGNVPARDRNGISADQVEELVFICHMDTVPAGGGWTKDPFAASEEDGRIYGRGSCDMKSGLAAAFSAFVNKAREYKENGGAPERTLKFIATSDEEADMLGSRRVLELGWVGRDSLVMDCEPTDGMIQTAHKGRFWYELQIHGKAAHASRPQDGADAIAGMAYAICAAREMVSELKSDDFLGKNTIVFGRIDGGTQLYQVAGECRASVDIRAVPPYTAQSMKKLLEDAASSAAEKIPGIKYTVKQTAQKAPVPHYPDSRMLSLLQEAIEQAAGRRAQVGPFPGYTDTAVIASETGNHNCLSYGPGSLSMAHKADEYVEISDICRCASVYKALADEWTGNM